MYVCSVLLSGVWARSLEFYHLLPSRGKFKNERVFMGSANTERRGKITIYFFIVFLLVSESPGGSEILVYTIYRGKKVMNQEPWPKARKHEYHKGAFTLAALGGAYHPSTAQHSLCLCPGLQPPSNHAKTFYSEGQMFS